MSKLFSQSRFITVEGGEGVGKSLFTAALAERLRQRRGTLVTTREPGGTGVADQIRAIFAAPPAGESLSAVTEALLVSAARSQHVAHLIKPALAAGRWVLCDRFADSTRVYQGAVGGVPRAELEAMIALSTCGLRPDVTFLLDAPVAVTLARVQQRRSVDSVERYDHAAASVHERLRAAFLELREQEATRIVLIDAESSPAAMVEQAWTVLEERFGA